MTGSEPERVTELLLAWGWGESCARSSSTTPAPARPPSGARLVELRYSSAAVLEEVGLVYRALDTRLGREVAI
jgi:hypothetical protein